MLYIEKIGIVIVVLLIFTLLLTLNVEGAEKIVRRTGTVAAIDISAKSLTLIYKSEAIIINLSDNTLVKMDKKNKSLSDIKVRDTVILKFGSKTKIAKTIQILIHKEKNIKK